uniref:Uncharacterized protein n=1 Tax=Arundo donax TaxID=35708 RepID=A0A0A9CCY1_ARUDO
MTGPLIAKLR